MTTTVVVGLTRASQRKRSPREHVDGQVADDNPLATASSEVDVAPEELAAVPRRAVVANRISSLATAAMIVVLVAWAVGGFDAGPEFRASAATPNSTQLQTSSQLSDPLLLDQMPPGAVQGSPGGTGDQPLAAQQARQDAAPSATDSVGVSSGTPPVGDVQRADPTSIHIPAIGLNAPVIGLGIDPNGALQVPTDFSQTGWWTGGPEPGEPGPAVVVGHVDSYVGPAVFFELRNLADGDRIRIAREDGSTAVFAVRGSVQALKSAFPTDLVYGPTDDAQLRLITCDGDFANGSYLGNLIVTAELVGETSPPSRGIAT